MTKSVIVSGARTPIGKLAGAFATLSAQDLGGHAIRAALERAGVDPELVDLVLMGQVIQAGQGQITARQAAVKGGIPMTVNATTVNKVCLSGLQTIYLADLMIRSGEAEIVVAGGMESMTNAPYLLPGARAGYRIGDQTVVDSMMFDGLTCAFDHCAMGLATERYNDGRITRQRQDEFSARSHQLAAAAIASGKFAEEIVSVGVPQRKGDPLMVATDEGVRGETTVESLGALRPAFDKDGTITAGNASQISDGAAAVVLMSAEKAAEPWHGGRTGRLAAHPTLARHCQGGRQGGHRRECAGSHRDQRSVRRRWTLLGRRPQTRRVDRQRQRRRHRARTPGRHVGHPFSAHCALRTPSSRRRISGGGALRRWGPGRRRDPSYALVLFQIDNAQPGGPDDGAHWT